MISGKGGREVGGDAKEPDLCWSQCGTAQEAAFRDTRIPVHAIAAAAGRQGRAHQGMVQDRILEPTRQEQTQDHEDFERVIGDATVEVKIWPFFVTHRLMGMAVTAASSSGTSASASFVCQCASSAVNSGSSLAWRGSFCAGGDGKLKVSY